MSTLPDYPEALAVALEGLAALDRIERVAIEEADGRVLAEEITADRDLPPFDRAQMDGYALRHEDLAARDSWAVVGRIAAGESASITIGPGQCAAIATGAPLPPGADIVIQHEWTDRGSPMRLTRPRQEILSEVKCGHAVHHRGSDAKREDRVVESGIVLGPQHLGIAAAVGRAHVAARPKPRVIVLSSGDEIVPIESAVLPHQIRNSNGLMVSALSRRFGAQVIEHRHLKDDQGATLEAVKSAIAQADLLVTIGGVSAGDRDYFPKAFEAHEVTALVRGAALQPGGPIFVGRTSGAAMIVGLPGNPVSALACSCLFIWPIVRRMLGIDERLPWRMLRLAEAVRPNPKRRAYRPAILIDAQSVHVPAWSGSGDLVHTARADGLLELPVQSEPVAAGTMLRFLPWP